MEVIQAQAYPDEYVSSSHIRQLLKEGRIEEANHLLGYNYIISGRIVKGFQIGRTIGFPTANIEVEEDLLVPKNGVYAVESEINGLSYGGMMNIGLRPTFKKKLERTVEVHFFDFEGDLYGQKLTVRIKSKLRSEKKFRGPEEIISQLHKDKQQALNVLHQ